MSRVNTVGLIFRDFFKNQENSLRSKQQTVRHTNANAEWQYWPDYLKRDIGMIDVSTVPDKTRRFNMMF